MESLSNENQVQDPKEEVESLTANDHESKQSNENQVQDLKEEVEMEDSLTANDHESKQPEIVEIKDPGCASESKDAHSDNFTKDMKKKKKKKKKKKESETEQSYEKCELATEEMYKDRDLYLAAINGDLAHFKRILDLISEDDILSRLTVTGNTFLHVAAKHKREDMVTFIASVKPSLVLAKNFDGETALHLATKSGDESMVKTLLGIVRHNETEKHDLLMTENEMGNTVLHEALLRGCESIARFLIQQDSELSYHLNYRLESAIYLAVKAGLVECVSSILVQYSDESRLKEIFENNSPRLWLTEFKNPIEAAIQRKDTVILKEIMEAKPVLLKVKDDKGKNPLHIAASLGHLEAARYLLKKYPFNAARRDKFGELPIHFAAREGHIDIIKLLLKDFLEADELLNRDGRSILHIGALEGRHNVVSFVLNHQNLDPLINMKDAYGDTALHIACKLHHPMIAGTLIWDIRVDTMAVNKQGMTALDAAYERDLRKPITLAMYLIWAALKAASVPGHFVSGMMEYADEKVNKERVNTLLLVATLVATVTFAAGFTMPGGYISSETGTDLGMATMWRHTVFHIFVLCDTIAMYTSIVAVTALIWDQIGDTNLVINALEFAALLLGVALIMMSVAFTAGVTMVVTKLRWLQITLLAMGVSFSALLILLLLPMCVLLPVCALLTSRNPMLRYISYYPFCFLALISRTRHRMHR